MKYSEITIAEVSEYLRVSDEDNLINILMTASKSFVKSYTGLSIEQLDLYEDIPVAILCLCAEMYDNRQFTVSKKDVNPVIKTILDMYCINLL
jgi:N12 class adenine-specific DNA methylase